MDDVKFFKCNACEGLYRDRQADGCEYHHVCSPTVVDTPAVVDEHSGVVLAAAVITKRAKVRNENVRVDPDTGKVSIISEGLGVTEITDAATIAALSATTGA